MNSLSALFNSGTIANEMTAYTQALQAFLNQHGIVLTEAQFLDHAAVKAYDTKDYELVIELLRTRWAEASEIEMNNRRLASIRLHDFLDFDSLGATTWLEVMEPRPEKVGADLVGFEHVEIYTPDLAAMAKILDEKEIEFEQYENPNHKALVVVINAQKQEVKFTNTSLAQIVAYQFKNSVANSL